VLLLREDHDQLVDMKSEVSRLHAIEQTYKLSTEHISQLQMTIAQLTADLDREQLDKEAAINEKEMLTKEYELVGKICFCHCCHTT